MDAKVFISHQSEFKPWVEWLARALVDHGFPVFLDKWHLVPGGTWVEGLDKGLRESGAAVLVATPEAVNSGWVRREHAKLMSRSTSEPGFRYVPLIFGSLPALAFLDSVQCVDCRDGSAYVDWFHRLVCGIEGSAPGGHTPSYPKLTRPPAAPAVASAQTAPAEQAFVERVMRQLQVATSPPVMVTSPGRRHQGAVISMLRVQGVRGFGADGVVHLVPACSTDADAAACFADLGAQCGSDRPTPSSLEFQAALQRRVATSGRQFVLITGFENTQPAFRAELAAALRVLVERCPSDLRVVLSGGQRLVEQRYGNGGLSFLSSAKVMEWPHPSAADVMAWQASDYPHAPLATEDAVQLLTSTGGHASLVRHGLEQWADRGPPPRWSDWALICPELWESWYRLRREVSSVDDLREALQRDSFGRATLWPPDELTRRLYWSDLLAPQMNGHLAWRCEPARQVGLEVVS